MTAHFGCSFLSARTTVWWKYTVDLSGQLELRYPKNGAGKRIPLTGQIQGNGTRFTFWADVNQAEAPPAGFIPWKQILIPPVLFIDSGRHNFGFSAITRMATPAYFYIPVQATLEDESMSLSILPAAFDFTDAVSNQDIAVYVQTVVPIPLFKTFLFPVPKARFILSRRILKSAKVSVSKAEDTLIIDKEFNRNWQSPGGDIACSWHIKIHAESKEE
ncbi:hypothetical protein [Acidiphilium acidophilum]|uniref:hypothetical protein n=1 Tax=Acidiphilium acidophilum TaxID=76588 RepID=UPI002E8E797C|nr:hypothetical protein [Acidiphilium acidophilum]